MKKTLSKILLSCAAVMSLSAVMAVSAFAADNDITDKYTAGTDTTNPTIAVPNSPAAAGAQGTIIIYKGQTATQDSIVYIDQDTVNATQDNWKETKLPASVDDVAEGESVTYTVKMGGTGVDANSVAVYTFTVGEVDEETVDYQLGDVDQNNVVEAKDAMLIARYSVGLESAKKIVNKSVNSHTLADVDENTVIEGKDAMLAARVAANIESAAKFKKTVSLPKADDDVAYVEPTE